MTAFGVSRRRAPARILAALLTLAASLAVVFADADDWTLDALLARLDLPQGQPLTYRQERVSGLLAEPVSTRGEITYRHPGYLRKTTRGGDGERLLVIERGRVRLQGPDGSRNRALDDMPALQALMGVLDALARGDAAALRRDYRARLTGTPDAWKLTLAAAAERRGGAGASRSEETRIRLSGGRRIERIRLDSEAFGRVTMVLGEAAQ